MTYHDKGVETAGESGSARRPGLDLIERTHSDVREVLSDYLDGTLGPSERERVREHLDDCEACRAFLETLRRTVEETGQLPQRKLPAEARRRVLDRLKAAPRSS